MEYPIGERGGVSRKRTERKGAVINVETRVPTFSLEKKNAGAYKIKKGSSKGRSPTGTEVFHGPTEVRDMGGGVHQMEERVRSTYSQGESMGENG